MKKPAEYFIFTMRKKSRVCLLQKSVKVQEKLFEIKFLNPLRSV